MSEPMPDLDNAVLTDPPSDDSDEPTRTRKQRSDKGKPRGTGGRRTSASVHKQIADDLLVPYATFAAGFSMMAPTMAGVMMTRGEKTVDAVVKLAAKNPRMLAALKKASVVGPAFEIAETVLMMAVAGAMDFGRIPADHPLGMMTGVTNVYREMHPDFQMSGPDASHNAPGMADIPNSMPYVPPPSNGMSFTGPPVTDPSSQWNMPAM